MTEKEFDGGYENVYEVAAVAFILKIPAGTLRYWFRAGMLGDGNYIETGGRWKNTGQLCFGPSAVLAAITIQSMRRYTQSLEPLKALTSWLSDLSMKDLELAETHDQVVIVADDIEPQFVGTDHELLHEVGREPRVSFLRIAHVMPLLRKVLAALDASTKEAATYE